MPSKRWNEQNLRDAVVSSLSISQVLKKLGLRATGGNYWNIQRNIDKFDIDDSHFTGQSWSKGKTIVTSTSLGKRSLDQVLTIGSHVDGPRLRKWLIDAGIKEHRCDKCGNTEWLEEPIPLEIEHINGNHFDNRLENLQFLCPNCHAKTPTYRNRRRAPVLQLG